MLSLRKQKPDTAVVITGQLRVFPNIYKTFFRNLNLIKKYTNLELFFYISYEVNVNILHINSFANKHGITEEESLVRHNKLYPIIDRDKFLNIIESTNFKYNYESYTTEEVTQNICEPDKSINSSNKKYTKFSHLLQGNTEQHCLNMVMNREKHRNKVYNNIIKIRPDYLLSQYGVGLIINYFTHKSTPLLHWDYFYLYPRNLMLLHYERKNQLGYLSDIAKLLDCSLEESGDIIFKALLKKNDIPYNATKYMGHVFPNEGRNGN